MAMLDQATIDYVLEKSDIVSVVGHYLPLIQKGKSVKCLCPFHDDHDPSLSISTAKQIFKCFVCGVAGNVFTFVSDFEQISYPAAVKRVAEISGIPFTADIEKKEKYVDPKYKEYYNLLQESVNFTKYQLYLLENKQFLDYLYSRDLTDDIIKKFQIGYQPKGNKLSQFLFAKGYKKETMLAVNLIGEDENRVYDVFANRITYPLLDEYGNVTGYSARSLLNDQAKYINSASSAVYQKSNLVYNYKEARSFCRKLNQVIVCEGVMDVIALSKVGINNAVATLGTACTVEQLKKIRQLSTNICVFYDGDRAGQQATYKLGKLAANNNIVVNIIDNDTELDPDEIIQQHSVDKLKDICSKYLVWIEFLFAYLQKQYDIRNFSQKEKFAKEILAEINRLNDNNHKQYFLNQLNELTKFNLKLSSNEANPTISKAVKMVNTALRAQMEVINQMIKGREAISIFQDQLGYLPDEDLNRLAMQIVKSDSEGIKMEEAHLYNMVSEKRQQELLSEILTLELLQKDSNPAVMQDAVVTVKRMGISDKIKVLDRKIKETADSTEKSELQKEKIKLKTQELSLLPKKEAN